MKLNWRNSIAYHFWYNWFTTKQKQKVITMEYNNTTTNSRKNKHLKDFERGQIELLHNKGYSAYKIAKELGRASNTIRNELKRGTVSQIKMINGISILS